MKIIYHRANTRSAIQKALESRPDKIEVDARVNSKGEVVLSHDAPKQDCLSLDEALKLINGRCPVIVEIKPGEPVESIVEVISSYKTVEIASFDFRILLDVKKSLPKTTLVVLEKWSGVRATRKARRLGTQFIAINHKWLWSGFVRSMSASDFKLSAYTLNDPKKARIWAKYGLYAVVTDYPEKFVS